MAFDDDFQNLAAALAAGVPAAPTDAVDVRAKLDALLRTLGAGANRRGGTIYIPRLPGGQLWVDVTTTPLLIPREVTLAVAPGVVIVPVYTGASVGDGARYLEIEGVLDAPIATVFATRGWFARQSPAGAARYQVGAVRLTSPHLERVHPEWWGAGDPSDPARPSDSEALTAALHAALRDRLRAGATGRAPLRPLPVELRGSYTLRQTLTIDASGMGSEQGLELRGAAGAPDAPTFQCAEAFPFGDAMMVVRQMKAVVLDDLRFDGGALAETCLVITDRLLPTGGEEPPGVPADRPHVLRRCEFRGALGALVSYAVSAPPATEPRLRSEGIHFEHCAFRPGGMRHESPGAALEVNGPPTTAVEVRGCTFRGEASAMIHATTCTLTVASCHFHNAHLPLLAADVISTDTMHENGPTGGVDVFLDGPGGFVEVASLYAQDCRSTSPQFLVTRGGSTGPVVHATVVGLHYTRRPDVLFRREPIYVHEDRPRWFWDVFEMTPITYEAPPELKLVASPKVTAQKLPVSGSKTPFEAPTGLLPGTAANVIPQKGFVPKGGLRELPGATATVGDPQVPPILWRLSDAGSYLMLVGCRFDFPPFDPTAAVRGTPAAGPIVDLGVLREHSGVNPISVDNPGGRVEVPTWPAPPR